jgi:cytochrome c biogenesis factor
LLRPTTQEVSGGRDEDDSKGTEPFGEQTVLSVQETFSLMSLSGSVARREVFVSVSAFKPKVKNVSPHAWTAHCLIIIIVVVVVIIIIIVAFHGDE